MAAIHFALLFSLLAIGRSKCRRQQSPMGSRRSRPTRRSLRGRSRKKAPSALFAKAAVLGLLLATFDGCGGSPVLQSESDCFKAVGSDVQVNGACSGETVLFVKTRELKLNIAYGSGDDVGKNSLSLDVGGTSLKGEVMVDNNDNAFIHIDGSTYYFPIGGVVKEGGIDVKDKDQKRLTFFSTPHFEKTENGFKVAIDYKGDAALGSLSITFVSASLNSPSDALATWAIVLIVLAAVALLGLVAAVVFAVWYRKCRKAKPTPVTPMQYIYAKADEPKGACGRRKAPQQPFVPPPIEEDPNTVKPAPVAEYTAMTKPTTEATTDAPTPTTDPEFERLAPALAAHYKKAVKDRRGRKHRNKKISGKKDSQRKAIAQAQMESKAAEAEVERAQKHSDRLKDECKKLAGEKKAASERVAATQQTAETHRDLWLDNAAKTAPSLTTLLKSCTDDLCESAAPVQKPAEGPSATGTVEQPATTVDAPAPK